MNSIAVPHDQIVWPFLPFGFPVKTEVRHFLHLHSVVHFRQTIVACFVHSKFILFLWQKRDVLNLLQE